MIKITPKRYTVHCKDSTHVLNIKNSDTRNILLNTAKCIAESTNIYKANDKYHEYNEELFMNYFHAEIEITVYSII